MQKKLSIAILFLSISFNIYASDIKIPLNIQLDGAIHSATLEADLAKEWESIDGHKFIAMQNIRVIINDQGLFVSPSYPLSYESGASDYICQKLSYSHESYSQIEGLEKGDHLLVFSKDRLKLKKANDEEKSIKSLTCIGFRSFESPY